MEYNTAAQVMEYSEVYYYRRMSKKSKEKKHHGKKGVKWDINCNFSEKTIMTIAVKTVLRDGVIGKA